MPGRAGSQAVRRLFRRLVLLCLLVCSARPGAPAAESPDDDAWLRSVDPIILDHERALYRSLERDYQRDAFRREFWRVRDPYTQTGRNEFRERYEERLGIAEVEYGSLEDDRSRILLTHGEASRSIRVRCTTTRTPVEVWVYEGSELVDFRFVLVFVRPDNGRGLARIWHPARSGSLRAGLRSARSCVNGGIIDDLERQMREAGPKYVAQIDRVLLKPRPRSLEWVAAFRASTTEVPAATETFPAESAVEYLGRVGQRIAVRGIVRIDPAVATPSDFAGYRSYDFELVGETVHSAERFETFRYKFGFPVVGDDLTLVFHRLLRPGPHRWVLRVEDLNAGRYFRTEHELAVPAMDAAWESPARSQSRGEEWLESATEELTDEGARIQIVPPNERLQTGFVRLGTLASGESVRRVAFFLDEQLVVTKNRPPFEVSLDLGPFPRMRRVRVEALDEAGTTVAWDEIELNAGRQRFATRFVSPLPGAGSRDSVHAEVALSVPDGALVERVEFFVDEERRATLYQEPWSQVLRLPDQPSASYLRAVSFLADGNRSEDIVFLNSSGAEERMEVQFVELFVSVTESDGTFAEGLTARDFRIEEDGAAQEVQRFELVEDLPIHVGVVLDNSASMGDSLDEARRAVLSFFEQALTASDRAAVITFNRFPHLAVPLTNDLATLGGGLAGLSAEGQTSLFDSVVFALYYLTGVTGQRAILLLSDGRDETSEFTYERTLEYARRAGVTIYSIGLGLPDGRARERLRRLAEETGGASFFIGSVGQLGQIYSRIQADLRSQYLVAYQSTNNEQDDVFREVRVEVQGHPSSRVRTMSGYYP